MNRCIFNIIYQKETILKEILSLSSLCIRVTLADFMDSGNKKYTLSKGQNLLDKTEIPLKLQKYFFLKLSLNLYYFQAL